MRKLFILAAAALPLAACATSPYGYGYNNNPLGAVIGSIGALGSPYSYGGYGYGSGFSQSAVNACASYASRYGGSVSIRNVQMLDSSHAKVAGYVNQGYRNEGWDCTFRSDGRITDFDI